MRPSEALLLLLRCPLGRWDVTPLNEREYTALCERLRGAPTQTPTVDGLVACGFSPAFARRVADLAAGEAILHAYLSAPNVRVLTRLSEGFPPALRKLGAACPPALFLRGDVSFFDTPCVALTGSRRLPEAHRRFAAHIGTLAAREGLTLVSGGAVGADEAAQNACLRAGGRVICFLPDALCDHPPRENVLYCSEEGWEVPFSVPRALRRNRCIHALGGRAFVARCTEGQGGSWRGAVESMQAGLSEVFIYDDGSPDAAALAALGATPLRDFPVTLRGLRPPQLSIFD